MAEYQRILTALEHHEQGAFALATLRLGLLHEGVAVDFWRGVAANPPRPDSPPEQRPVASRLSPGEAPVARPSPDRGSRKRQLSSG